MSSNNIIDLLAIARLNLHISTILPSEPSFRVKPGHRNLDFTRSSYYSNPVFPQSQFNWDFSRFPPEYSAKSDDGSDPAENLGCFSFMHVSVAE